MSTNYLIVKITVPAKSPAQAIQLHKEIKQRLCGFPGICFDDEKPDVDLTEEQKPKKKSKKKKE